MSAERKRRRERYPEGGFRLIIPNSKSLHEWTKNYIEISADSFSDDPFSLKWETHMEETLFEKFSIYLTSGYTVKEGPFVQVISNLWTYDPEDRKRFARSGHLVAQKLADMGKNIRTVRDERTGTSISIMAADKMTDLLILRLGYNILENPGKGYGGSMTKRPEEFPIKIETGVENSALPREETDFINALQSYKDLTELTIKALYEVMIVRSPNVSLTLKV